LATEKAKAIAKKKGIKDPQKADECLSCHVTAHGVSAKLIGPKFKIEDGVGCESCHGPGSAYKSKKVMTAVYKGKTDPATVGLIKPTEKTCLQCHNKKSPTFKGFDFKKMFKQIEHPVPKKAAK
ncbi:MAG: cytochrome C554, partial [Calditrichaeota bacterium]